MKQIKFTSLFLLISFFSFNGYAKKRKLASLEDLTYRVFAQGSEPPYVESWDITCFDNKILNYLRLAKTNSMDPEISKVEVKDSGLIVIGPHPEIKIQPNSGCLVKHNKSLLLRKK